MSCCFSWLVENTLLLVQKRQVIVVKWWVECWVCFWPFWLLTVLLTHDQLQVFPLHVKNVQHKLLLCNYPPNKMLLSLTVLRQQLHTVGSSFLVVPPLCLSGGFVYQHRMALRMVIILAPSAVSVPYPVTAKSRWKMTSVEQAGTNEWAGGVSV